MMRLIRNSQGFCAIIIVWGKIKVGKNVKHRERERNDGTNMHAHTVDRLSANGVDHCIQSYILNHLYCNGTMCTHLAEAHK